ncbi:small nucleolar ribonucleoprotein complex subunit [Grosmannia clavigera kw1407]|uniref:DDB1- and CUL4-associated factor 13 n=1 Tax=Grosmannia clavigera (strain kw1407 / UAMH 11150) TaxID=655863 RepID=F0X840_GROCL|nr:small nucleolar ribonucleoprotein complex subunit [Grosmannia clavigera kw1407]EFX06164.1 small nucleolar ribonucleoprotein complex subunit [Grosmannia clavigera kw1407]
MKVKVLNRAPAASQHQQRNHDPALHPFEQAREYTRALTAAKLDRMFAAPFIAQLGAGHQDGVYCLAKDVETTDRLASASADGIVKVWDLSTRAETQRAKAHEARQGMVKGISWIKNQSGRYLVSCGTDRNISVIDTATGAVTSGLGDCAFTSVSSHRTTPTAVVSGSSRIFVYDVSRPTPTVTETLQWPKSVDTITAIRLNQVETSILGTCGSDRSLVFFDLRTSMPVHKTVLNFACNDLAWNPQEAMNFAVGSEDYNIYHFDMRNMQRSRNIQKGHTGAVMSLDFNPTGTELVSGSWDRTIRLFKTDQGTSRDIYHTKRQGRVQAVAWSPDSNYILTGSDEGNVRLWRANASQRLGIKSAAEKTKLEYDATLKERYQHMPEVRRILRHRHLPKVVKKAQDINREMLQSIKRKDENRRKHSKAKDAKRASARDQMILANVK